ncbi:proteinase inhibitor-like isoform X2 [Tachypleus tridentatus]|uniref:proteinase inhibitor-like isoform X2 n=1 Tax=Tachypleus tridentatus TaxID=6853 RepID=UPI003FD1F243
MSRKVLLFVVGILLYVAVTAAKGPFLDCTSPPVTGPCRAEFKRYNYNTRTKQCEPFIYGGCKGNGNRYKSEQDCLDACSGF